MQWFIICDPNQRNTHEVTKSSRCNTIITFHKRARHSCAVTLLISALNVNCSTGVGSLDRDIAMPWTSRQRRTRAVATLGWLLLGLATIDKQAEKKRRNKLNPCHIPYGILFIRRVHYEFGGVQFRHKTVVTIAICSP